MEILTGQRKIIKTALAILAAVMVLSWGADVSWAEKKNPEKIKPGVRVLINLDENIVIETTVDEGLQHTLRKYENEMAGVGFGAEAARKAAEIQKRMMGGFYNKAVNDAGQRQAIGLTALNGEIVVFGPSKSPTSLVRDSGVEKRLGDDVMFMLSELMIQADDILADKMRDRTYTALELAGSEADAGIDMGDGYIAPKVSPSASLNTADDIILQMFDIWE